MIRAAHMRSRACGSRVKNVIIAGSCLALTASGCAFQGLNSLPLPGAVGRGPDAVKYHVEVPNVATMESNSPVMINDVVVGSVAKMSFSNWHINLELSVMPDVVCESKPPVDSRLPLSKMMWTRFPGR